ncbi:MAG TPA: hypothetical protein VFW46_12210 [Stellaceae bacterium]|nr:hypothetical protein [Stellaceae bacterium]
MTPLGYLLDTNVVSKPLKIDEIEIDYADRVFPVDSAVARPWA